MTETRNGGPGTGTAAHTEHSSTDQDDLLSVAGPLDDDDGIAAVVADDAVRARWRAADGAVRLALRNLPASPDLEVARSLIAVARIVDRRRTARAALEAVAR